MTNANIPIIQILMLYTEYSTRFEEAQNHKLYVSLELDFGYAFHVWAYDE